MLKARPPQNMTVEPVEKQSSAEGAISRILQDSFRKINVTKSLPTMRQEIEYMKKFLDGYAKKNDAFVKAAVI